MLPIKKTRVLCFIFLAFYSEFSQVEAYDTVTCSSDSSCSSGKCCNSDGKCTRDCGLADWIIALIVVSVIVFIVIFFHAVVICCRSATRSTVRPATSGVVFVSQAATIGPTVVLNQQHYGVQQGSEPMYYQPYPNEPPPPYLPQHTTYLSGASGPPTTEMIQ